MPNSKDFKHIKVGSAQNDEVVIKAGKPSADEPAVASSGIDETPEDVSTNSQSTSTEEKADGNEVRNSSAPDSSYSPTTLEDLEVSKMSWTQIVVIGVALIALASFIIWYMVFS